MATKWTFEWYNQGSQVRRYGPSRYDATITIERDYMQGTEIPNETFLKLFRKHAPAIDKADPQANWASWFLKSITRLDWNKVRIVSEQVYLD